MVNGGCPNEYDLKDGVSEIASMCKRVSVSVVLDIALEFMSRFSLSVVDKWRMGEFDRVTVGKKEALMVLSVLIGRLQVQGLWTAVPVAADCGAEAGD